MVLAATNSAPTCTISGTSGNDILVGTPGSDVICGLGGNDTIYGLGGNDKIYGGEGNDTILGGTGNDLIDGGTGTDSVSYTDAKAMMAKAEEVGRVLTVGTHYRWSTPMRAACPECEDLVMVPVLSEMPPTREPAMPNAISVWSP